MRNIKNLFALVLFAVTITFSACTTEDKCASVTCLNGQVCVDGTCVGSATNIIVSSNISTNTTWTAANIYELDGRITVLSGVTLTIEAGTIIKGQAGTGANATALLIARGAKIMANGTAAKPIIFTSVADEIAIADINAGNFASPNLEPTANGLWGGLIVLGNAPISASTATVQIEGIPATDQNGLYGGTDVADNSGSITYISIRHGGANIGGGNEINGLTLGGVGSATTIHHIEIIGNQDDGVEFFGGSVSVSHLLILNSYDDAVDTDQSWSGTLDNFIVICGAATDHALEIDGPEGSMLASHTIKNGSIKGTSTSELGDFRSCARGSFENLFFFGFPNPTTTYVDLSLSDPTSSTCTTDNFASAILTFSAMQLDTTGMGSPALSAVFKSGTDVHATIVSTSNRTVGATKAAFASWTWADDANFLTNF